MKLFDGNIFSSDGQRTLLDYARQTKKFYSFGQLLAPWHYQIHIPSNADQKKVASFKFNGQDETEVPDDVYDKNKPWAISFKEEDYMQIMITNSSTGYTELYNKSSNGMLIRDLTRIKKQMLEHYILHTKFDFYEDANTKMGEVCFFEGGKMKFDQEIGTWMTTDDAKFQMKYTDDYLKFHFDKDLVEATCYEP